MQHAMEALKNTCSNDLDAVWLLHILRRIRQMYASLIHLDLPSDALDIFGKFILDLRYEMLLRYFLSFIIHNEFEFSKLDCGAFVLCSNKLKRI